MELFRELAVKIIGLNGTKGTGCIYDLSRESGRKYILTAQHCLSSDKQKRTFEYLETKDIVIYDFCGDIIQVAEIYIPENPNLDFAIIEFFSGKSYKSITIKEPVRGMKYTFFGFPYYLKDDTDSGEPLEGHIVEVKETTITLQHGNGALSDEDSDARDNTVGFSGSGIYCEEEGAYHLIGILIKLRGKGKHGRLMGVNINEINSFLSEKGLDLLFPYELMDFKIYLKTLLQDEDTKFQSVLTRQFDKYLVDINPNYIFQKLREKLFLPYNADGNILNEKLWEGWLRFLLYISLGNGEILSLKNINKYVFIENPKNSRNRFFFTEEKRMATFVTHLYGTSYRDIQHNDLIFVNSEKFKGSKMPTFSEIHQIIQNIDSPFMYEEGIDISNPSELKKVKVIHLDYLIDEIENELLACLGARKNIKEIETACIQCLKKLFRNFEIDSFEEEVPAVEVDRYRKHK